MNDRQLRDIGLTRHDVDVMNQGTRSTSSPGVIGAVAGAFRSWNADRKGRNELLSLDARTLADIGLTRAEVERMAANTRTVVFGLGKLMRWIGGVITQVFDETRLRHRQFSELSHMDDRQLADIGIARSDIWSVVYEGYNPLGKTLHAANANGRKGDGGRMAA